MHQKKLLKEQCETVLDDEDIAPNNYSDRDSEEENTSYNDQIEKPMNHTSNNSQPQANRYNFCYS